MHTNQVFYLAYSIVVRCEYISSCPDYHPRLKGTDSGMQRLSVENFVFLYVVSPCSVVQ
jgi:hypothetical protein